MAIIRLADGLVERLVLDVIEPAAVERARRDRRGVPVSDELGEKVVRLLAVRETGERAVLPFEKHAGEDEHVDEKPRLADREAQIHQRLDATRADAFLPRLLDSFSVVFGKQQIVRLGLRRGRPARP